MTKLEHKSFAKLQITALNATVCFRW